jgi:hypothetical protein
MSSSIAILPWRHKANHRPRYSVYTGQSRLGDIFESKGVFTAVTTDGRLVVASMSFQGAANALVPATRAST